jgi:hypothetical protein
VRNRAVRSVLIMGVVLTALVGGGTPAFADDPIAVPGGGIVQGPPPTVSGSNPTTVHFSRLAFYGTLRAGGHNYIGPFAVFDLEAQIYEGTPGCNTPGSDPLECEPVVNGLGLGPGQSSSSTNVVTLYGDHTYDIVVGTCGGPGSMVSASQVFLLCTVSIDAGPPGQLFLTARLLTDQWALRGTYTANALL